jgi:hypothetical protein
MKLKNGDVIPYGWRQEAASRLASRLDKLARYFSRYGQPQNVTLPAYDEDMVYTAISDWLGCLWQMLPESEFERVLNSFQGAIRVARMRRLQPAEGEKVN